MLKPDSTRYPSVIQTRIIGPEWLDSDATEPGEEFSDVLAFGGREDLPADLALDLKLHEILLQARLSTAASGAVIALARGDKLICRATLGEKAPSVGAYLNPRSGLSGTCVQTREMQLCDDTLADPRVNTSVCRDLGIRSIAVLPLIDSRELWGVFEVFSTYPRAFSDPDLQSLQALSRKISNIVHDAIEGGSAAAETQETFETEDGAEPLAIDSSSETTPSETAKLEASSQPEAAMVRRDYATGALTAAVLALAVLLGWMVGRVGWSMAVNRAPGSTLITPEEAQTHALVVPDTHPDSPRSEPPAPPAKADRSKSTPAASTKVAPKPKAPPADAVDANAGLVVYERGKLVFRMAPAGKGVAGGNESGPAGSGGIPGGIQRAATREQDDTAAAISSPPENDYLVKRVEPEYPESARLQHIEGAVVLNLLVGTDGAVREMEVVSGDPQLIKAATDAVRQWRFKPHELKGKAVEFETQITLNFALPVGQ